MTKRALFGGAGLAVFATFTACVIPVSAHPVNGNLPGGTSIAVSIDSPPDGAARPPGVLPVNGTASVGQGRQHGNNGPGRLRRRPEQ